MDWKVAYQRGVVHGAGAEQQDLEAGIAGRENTSAAWPGTTRILALHGRLPASPNLAAMDKSGQRLTEAYVFE